MQVLRAEDSLLLLPSVETRTVVSALRGILSELYEGRVAIIFVQNSFLFCANYEQSPSGSDILSWPRSG